MPDKKYIPPAPLPYNPLTTTTGEDRIAQGNYLDSVLKNRTNPEFSNPQIITAGNVQNSVFDPKDYVDDPTMEMAIHLTKARYPDLFKGINVIHVGVSQPANINGRYFPGSATISLKHSGGSFKEAMNTLLHELSHSVGTEDKFDTSKPMDPKSAYDVGYASDQLNKDIYLPAEKAKK